MATKAWQISDRIIGDPAKETQGSGKPRLGFHDSSRIRAGVVVDVPAPASWLELAAELPGAPQTQPAKRKPGFINSCNIRDGVAHVSSEAFHSILVGRRMHDVKKAGAASIVIEDNGDFKAELVFEQEFSVPAPEERIAVEDILRHGVTTALKYRTHATLINTVGKHALATLYTTRQTPDLGQAFAFSALTPGQAPAQNSVLFSAFLMAAVSRPLALRQVPLAGLELAVPGSAGPVTVAYAWQPAEWLAQSASSTLETLVPATIQDVGRKLRAAHEQDADISSQKIFGQAAGYLMHLRRRNRENVDEANTSVVIVPGFKISGS